MPVTPIKFDRLTTAHLAAAAALAVAGVAVTWEAWRDIFDIAYKDEEYSHIFLVPFVVGWLLWVRRMRFRHLPHSGTVVGPLFVALGWALSQFGFNHGVQSAWHFGSVLVVLGCVLSVLGKHALFRFFPAILVLAFLVPVPQDLRQRIALPLQAWTAEIAHVILDLIGVEAVVSGNTLSVNGVPVTIVEACNGMRMVFPLLLIAYAFAFGLPLRQGVRVLLLVATPLTALFCNIVRIVPTVWMYGSSSRELAESFHDRSGWAMLPLAFVVLLLFIKVLRWAMLPVERYTLASQG